MAFYESTFIVRQELSAKDVDKITEKFSGVVKKNGGKVLKSEYWGLRTLAYPINKTSKGHYVHLRIEGETSIAGQIERSYRMDEDVIRNLTIRVDEVSNDDSPLLRNDEEPVIEFDPINDDNFSRG